MIKKNVYHIVYTKNVYYMLYITECLSNEYCKPLRIKDDNEQSVKNPVYKPVSYTHLSFYFRAGNNEEE